MRVRSVCAAAVAVSMLATVTGCRSNVGTAGSVNGARISESMVTSYVRPTGPDPSFVAQAKAQNQNVLPKSVVLQILLEERIFERALVARKALPTPGALSRSHDAAAKLLLQTTLTGAALDKALATSLGRSGVRASFVPVLTRTQDLEYTLIRAIKATSLADLAAEAKRDGAVVSVSPRYGSWDAASLQIKADGARPGFLQLQPTAASSSAAG